MPASIKNSVIIATKAGLRDNGQRDFSPAYIESRIERSLRRLKINQISLFQLNKPNDAQLTPEIFECLERLKAIGKIAFAGLIVSDLKSARDALQTGGVDCIQVFYNLLHSDMVPLIVEAAAANVGVLVRSPLNSGLLSGAYNQSTSFPPEDERALFFSGKPFKSRLHALRSIQDELGIQNADLLDFALRYALSNTGVSALLVGASEPKQVARYVSSLTSKTLSFSEQDKIRACVSRIMKNVRTPTQFDDVVPKWT